MNALYNEIDTFASAWLDALIADDCIAAGRVERRSIADLSPDDVAGPGQRHFFAGIGGWSYALRLAGVADDADVWTGSCPCQPFSAAGARGGTSDPRHLWPAWFALIEQCRPSIIFGEQVAGPDGLVWLDLVYADLERCGYSVGSAIISAASVSAPHRRERIYFVANADGSARDWRQRVQLRPRRPRPDSANAGRASSSGGVGNADSQSGGRNTRAVPRAKGEARRALRRGADGSGVAGDTRTLADGDGTRSQGRIAVRRRGDERTPRQSCMAGGVADNASMRRLEGFDERQDEGSIKDRSRLTHDCWSDCEWIPCRDPKHGVVYRPVEPGTFPLAHGVPGRVGRLRGYGNAIVPQVAAVFIEAALDAIGR